MLTLLIALIIVGGLLYIINLLPIDPTLKQIARILIILVFAVYALQILFGSGGLIDLRLPR